MLVVRRGALTPRSSGAVTPRAGGNVADDGDQLAVAAAVIRSTQKFALVIVEPRTSAMPHDRSADA